MRKFIHLVGAVLGKQEAIPLKVPALTNTRILCGNCAVETPMPEDKSGPPSPPRMTLLTTAGTCSCGSRSYVLMSKLQRRPVVGPTREIARQKIDEYYDQKSTNERIRIN